MSYVPGLTFLVDEIAQRLFERLQYILMQPQQVLLHEWLESPWLQRQLQQHYANAVIHTLGTSAPFSGSGLDMVLANFLPPSSVTDTRNLLQWRNAVRPGGLWMFTCLGPDSLRELRHCFAQIDDQPHVMPFVDMHDIGDALLQHGWHDPVMDMETLTVHYPELSTLCRDLKASGASKLMPERARGLYGKNAWQRVQQQYELLRVTEGLPVTLEIIFGHAWVPEGSMTMALNEKGEAVIPVEFLRR